MMKIYNGRKLTVSHRKLLQSHSSRGYAHQYYHDHHHQEVVDYNEAPPSPYSHYDIPRREGSPHLHHSTSAPYPDTFAQQDAGNETATSPQQPGSPYLSGRSPAHPSPLVLNSFSCSEERRVAQSHSSYPQSSNIESPSSSPYHRTAQHQPDIYSDAYVEQHQHVPVLPPSGSSHQSEHYRLGRQPSIPRREPPAAHYARPRADQRSSEGSESEQTPNTSATSTDDSMQDGRQPRLRPNQWRCRVPWKETVPPLRLDCREPRARTSNRGKVSCRNPPSQPSNRKNQIIFSLCMRGNVLCIQFLMYFVL